MNEGHLIIVAPVSKAMKMFSKNLINNFKSFWNRLWLVGGLQADYFVQQNMHYTSSTTHSKLRLILCNIRTLVHTRRK